MCPLECNLTTYDISLSYAEYPSWTEYAHEMFIRGDWYARSFEIPKENVSYEMFKTSMSKIEIYYGELKYTHITQKPSVSFVEMVTNVGGALSLFLGASIMSFFEIIELAQIIFATILLNGIRNNKKR